MRRLAGGLLGAAVAGCVAGTPAAQGHTYVFSDLTPTALLETEAVGARPLAVGAQATIRVRRAEDAEILHLGSVASSAPGVVDAQLSDYENGFFVIRGLAPGHANVIAAGPDGRWQKLEVEAAAPARADVLFAPLFPHVTVPREIAGPRVAMLPGATVWLLPGYRDDQDRRLTGWGLAQWTVEGGGLVTNEQDSDFAVLRNERGGDFVVRFGELGRADVSTVEPSAITAFELYDHQQHQLFRADQTIPFEVGRLRLFHLVARTADGRYVIGAGEAPLAVEKETDRRNILRLVDANDEAPDRETADLLQQLGGGRGFMMGATFAGNATIAVTWSGKTTRWPVEATGE